MNAIAPDELVIEPLAGPLLGTTSVPGDKSISHRSVLFSAMAEGTSQVSGVLDSDDVRSSIAAVQQLGAQVALEKQVDGSLAGGITGWGSAGPTQPTRALDCGNSGTTARLLMGVLAPWDIAVTLDGDDSLRRRPMRRIYAPLMKMGVTFTPAGSEGLPVTEKGSRHLKALSYDSPMASAQLKTALLLAGLGAEGETRVCEPAASRNHTELMLPQFGAQTTAGERTASVIGPCQLTASEVHVPGDPSSAAFIVCAAVLARDSAVQIEGVSLNPARIGFTRTLERMGADVSITRTGMSGKEPYGIIEARWTEDLRGCEIPADKIASLVDEIPVLALVAAHAHGITVFRQVSELKVKESNRLAAVIEGLGRLGVDAWNEGDDLYIEGQPSLQYPCDLVFDSHHDHRLAMTWALVGLTGPNPVTVTGFDSVKISYPGFLASMEGLVR